MGSDGDISSDIIAKEKIEEVKEYLQKLDPEKREIVIMRIWDNLSYEEISEILGKSEASCKMSFSRVMAQLRKDISLTSLILLLLINKIL